MKFTKEEAFDELKRQLKAIVGEPAINDKAINESIATLMPLVAGEEMELAEFVTKILPVLKTGDGNARKYASNAVKKREKELMEQNADGKPDSDGAQKDETYAKLKEQVEALTQKLTESETKAALNAKRNELKKAIEGKGVKDRQWIDDFLGEVSVNAEMDIEESAERYAKLYNRSHADAPANVTPASGTGGKTEGDTFADLSNAMKARRAAEKGNITTN